MGDSLMKEIELTQGKVALVDDEDYECLARHEWRTLKNCNRYYAARSRSILMHRVIMNAQKGQEIDHKDGNGLDNRRTNLRFCTRSQNNQNRRKTWGSSQYKGVSWWKRDNEWEVSIKHNKKQYHLGHYKDEIHAAKVYDAKAKELFGEFAYLNFSAKAMDD